MKTMVTMILAGIMVIHIALSLLIAFTGNKRLTGNSFPSKAYIALVHPGPFFTEKTLQANPSLTVTTYKNKIVQTEEIFSGRIKSYYEKPWMTQHLLVKDFIRTEANSLISMTDSAKQVSKLSVFILRWHGTGADSVHVRYDGRYKDVRTRALRAQTFFQYTLIP